MNLTREVIGGDDNKPDDKPGCNGSHEGGMATMTGEEGRGEGNGGQQGEEDGGDHDNT
jgi:hypothetical protein